MARRGFCEGDGGCKEPMNNLLKDGRMGVTILVFSINHFS